MINRKSKWYEETMGQLVHGSTLLNPEKILRNDKLKKLLKADVDNSIFIVDDDILQASTKEKISDIKIFKYTISSGSFSKADAVFVFVKFNLSQSLQDIKNKANKLLSEYSSYIPLDANVKMYVKKGINTISFGDLINIDTHKSTSVSWYSLTALSCATVCYLYIFVDFIRKSISEPNISNIVFMITLLLLLGSVIAMVLLPIRIPRQK